MLTIYCQNVWNHTPASYRNKLIRSLAEDNNADICLFQEFGPETTRAARVPLDGLMNDVYQEACEEYNDRNYTPVFYKKDKFNFVDGGYFLYEGLNDANSKSVTWAVLEEKATATKFAVISTHFWWKFDSEKDNQQRLRNVEQLQEICDFIIEKHNVPVVVGGDLNNGKNSEQGEEPYEYMKQKGFMDTRLYADVTTDELTHHEYPILVENGDYVKGGMPERTLDYIFTYGNYDVKAKKFDVLTSDKALESSDHCPLIAEIEIH